MIIVTLAQIEAAEPERWPGYAAWVRSRAAQLGADVQHDRVRFTEAAYAVIRGEVAARSGKPRPVPLAAARVVAGAVGIVKAITGTGGAVAETVKARLAICGQCEHAELLAGVVRRCALCGCSTWAKVRNAGEACPAGKWAV